MKSEILIYATEFRGQAEKAWSAETAYPGQFDPQNISRGQCGVSSFGLGLWLVQKKGWDERELAYARGQLLTQGGTVIDPNHSWLEVNHESIRWQVDVTPDQYPGVEYLIVMQPAGSSETGLQYVAEKGKVTPLRDYDIARFSGRLAVFAGALELTI